MNSPQKVYHKVGIAIMSHPHGVEVNKDLFLKSLSNYLCLMNHDIIGNLIAIDLTVS